MDIELSKISAVIPYYKASETVGCTINCLLKAGLKENQMLIIDDNSKDGLLQKIIQKHSNINCIENKINLGAAHSRNIGILNSFGEYILFIDSDVYFNSKQLDVLLKNNSNYDIIFPKLVYEDGSIMTPNNDWERKYCMCSAIFLIKRKSLLKLDELFDINYSIYAEDSDFFLRCMFFGLKFKYISNAIFKHPVRLFYTEKGYYLRTRNIIFLSLKIGGIIKYRMPILIYLFGSIFLNFIKALSNRHINLSPIRLQSGSRYSYNYFARIRLLLLFFKAILWNISKIPILIRKRHKLKNIKNVCAYNNL